MRLAEERGGLYKYVSKAVSSRGKKVGKDSKISLGIEIKGN